MKTIERGFDLDGSRYRYDASLTADAGWQQYDTDQDAWYFGVWVNLKTLQTFTYAEGDTAMVTVTTEEEMKQELLDVEEFYGMQPPAFHLMTFDGKPDLYVYDKRPAL